MTSLKRLDVEAHCPFMCRDNLRKLSLHRLLPPNLTDLVIRTIWYPDDEELNQRNQEFHNRLHSQSHNNEIPGDEGDYWVCMVQQLIDLAPARPQYLRYPRRIELNWVSGRLPEQ